MERLPLDSLPSDRALYYGFPVTEEQMLDVVRNWGLLKDGDTNPRGSCYTFKLMSTLYIDYGVIDVARIENPEGPEWVIALECTTERWSRCKAKYDKIEELQSLFGIASPHKLKWYFDSCEGERWTSLIRMCGVRVDYSRVRRD